MFGRFFSASSPERIAEYVGAVFEGETLGENHNVAPTNDIYAVVAGPDGEPRLEVFHWGLIPVWAKEAKVGQKMINARAETLATNRVYRVRFKDNRCCVPMDGFYEWKPGNPDDRSRGPASRRSSRCTSTASTGSRWPSPGCGRHGRAPAGDPRAD
jgi:putative SOS response-associated peptidase YedK